VTSQTYSMIQKVVKPTAWEQSFLPPVPVMPGNRATFLEDRLSSQERTTTLLLDQAFRIKDDIVSYLHGSKNYQQGEATARQLLENHIQTITSIVKKLSHDIEILEKQIRTRDHTTTGTNFAVQSLDCKYLQGFGDLRGRVARCDASIAKLSGDLNIIRHEIQKIENDIYSLRSAMESYVSGFEKKVMQLLGKIETSSSEHSSNLKTVQGNHHHELQLLDFKMNSLLNELKEQAQNQQKWIETLLRRSEQEQANQTNQLLNAMKERLVRIEAVEEQLEADVHLSPKLERTDKLQHYEKEQSPMKNYANELHARMSRFERRMWNELAEIQNEYRSGFQSIHESLDSLQHIQNTKLKLEKQKIQKDIKKIRRKMMTELED
uniref:Family with sequence similarity 81 member B n=1 Tax=Crocodylus porosus TaxID=8502 RepID=A0A7M4E4U9_CROPO